MNKIIIVLLLACSFLEAMEIERICDEKTPLLLSVQEKPHIDLELGTQFCRNNNSAKTYLDTLPSNVRCLITRHFKPAEPGMKALLENVSFESDEALHLYKKFAFYNSVPKLPALIKSTARKQIKTSRKKYLFELIQLQQRACNLLIHEDPEAQQFKSFLEQEIMPVAMLDGINATNALGNCEQLFQGKKIIQSIDAFEKITKRDHEIADAAIRLHSRTQYGRRNFLVSGILILAATMACFLGTQYGINSDDYMENCAGIILANCSMSFNGCNMNDILNAFNYCNKTLHAKQKQEHYQNIQTWSLFSTGMCGLALVQMMILCARCIRPSYVINPQAKALADRYKDKINSAQRDIAQQNHLRS